MFLSSLFIVLGIVGVQPTENVPVQQTVHTSGIRYEFVHQEQNYILDLNNQREVLAYYINNVLQNPDLLPSTKGELLHYKTETKNDLVETFAVQRSRRRRREAGGQISHDYTPATSEDNENFVQSLAISAGVTALVPTPASPAFGVAALFFGLWAWLGF